MNLNQLEYFISAAELLNFTKAAQACFISQTAMTLQIRALEEQVGVPLFIRNKHHVVLTDAGKIYLQEAKVIIRRSQEAIRMARSASYGLQGSLHVGFNRGYGGSELTRLLREFHSAYPAISLSFSRDNYSPLHNRLVKGDCDVIFTVTSALQGTDPMIERKHLASYPLVAAMSPQLPLAEKPYVTYPDLKDEKFILMQPADRSKDEMEESLLIYERGGFLPDIVALESDPETLLLMVSIGIGISILPDFITRSHQQNQDLKLLPVVQADRSAETLDIEVNWKKDTANPAVEKLLDLIEQIKW